LLIKTQFPEITVAVAFLGPLVGSVSRPFGGILSDKVGGAKVTIWALVAMCGCVLGVMYFVEQKNFAGFLTMFLALFTLTGLGNGSTYMTIPAIFRAQNLHEAEGQGETGRKDRPLGNRRARGGGSRFLRVQRRDERGCHKHHRGYS